MSWLVNRIRKPTCPGCGHAANIHSRRTSTVYHRPYQEKPLLIRLNKMRFRCKVCRKTFDEAQPLISSCSPHISTEGYDYIVSCLLRGVPIAQIEDACGASKNITGKVEQGAFHHKRYLPHHLCIDEVRTCPKRIGIKRGTPHMAACIYDADRRILADMIQGDKPGHIRPYLEGFSKKERNQVESFSCDLNKDYISLEKELFPNACIYADKFHVAKLVSEGLDDIRKRIRNAFIAENEQDSDLAKAINACTKLYHKRKTGLSPRQKDRLIYAFSSPEAYDLKLAYLCEQLFFEWCDNTYSTREEMEEGLRFWIRMVKRCRIKEIVKPANTINRHIEYVLNAWHIGRTNAVAESLNRRIKDIIRECRGFNSFGALRRRCLWVLGHERIPNKPIPLFKRGDTKDAI